MVSVQRHLAVARGMLGPGEREVRWIRAERQPQGQAGALLLTDRRLLFSGMGFVAQSQEAWPLAVVRQPVVRQPVVRQPSARHASAVLTLHVAGLPEEFAGKAEDLRALADLLAADAREAEDDVAAGDLIGELERLTALRDTGALTAAEFEVAKRRLLR